MITFPIFITGYFGKGLCQKQFLKCTSAFKIKLLSQKGDLMMPALTIMHLLDCLEYYLVLKSEVI